MILKIFNFWFLCVVFFVNVSSTDIQIGNAIDLLQHYGMLTNLFLNQPNIHESLPIQFPQNIFKRQALKRGIVHFPLKENGVWTTKVHDNIAQVLKALFENYHIEFVENIENAFTASVSRKTISQLFDIDSRLLMNGYCYVLIKYQQNIARYSLVDSTTSGYELDARFLQSLENVSIGEEKSVFHIVSKFGSHYFKSFSVGEVIYQLFALPENRYQCLKKFESIVYEDISYCVNGTLEIFPGTIKTLGNSKTTEANLNTLYKSNQRWYSNLFDAKHQNISQYIEFPEKPVPTSFHLSAISAVIPQPKSSFIQEVINNQMVLRELHLFLRR